MTGVLLYADNSQLPARDCQPGPMPAGCHLRGTNSRQLRHSVGTATLPSPAIQTGVPVVALPDRAATPAGQPSHHGRLSLADLVSVLTVC